MCIRSKQQMAAREQTSVSLSLPWKTRIMMAAISAFSDSSCRSDGSVVRRLSFLDRKVPANPKPVRGVRSSDIVIDADRKLWFRLFVPDDAGTADDAVKLPVIVFFHGGGFVFLAANSQAYDFACRRFAKKCNAVVMSVNYRLAPEHKCPSQYEDGFDAMKFLDQNGSAILPKNADLSKCYLVGDSAGGNLAHHMAVKYASLSPESMFQNLRVKGLIAIQPFFGGEERSESELRLEGAPLVTIKRTDFMWKAFLPVGSNRDHEYVNVSGPNSIDISSLENFPKTLVVIGGYDPLQDWQRRYYEWLRKSGKDVQLEEYANSPHAFYIFPDLPDSSNFFELSNKFINSLITDD